MDDETADSAIPSVRRDDFQHAFRVLGLGPGDGVIVHSSLSSLGHVEGGADTVIDALQTVLTPIGTLLMPSFNHGAPFAPGGEGLFDPARTPTTNGAIPDAFWRRPDVRRSLNPTHAFAAWGVRAARYLEGHEHTLTLGADSPLGRLWQDDGYGLLIGVDYRVNTFHHLVETVTGAPCLGRRSEAYPVRLPGGRVVEGRTWGWREAPCPLTGDGSYGETLALQGLERRITVGSATLRLFRLADAFAVVAKLLREGRVGAPPCSGCPIRPRRVPQTVPSDWDEGWNRVV